MKEKLCPDNVVLRKNLQLSPAKVVPEWGRTTDLKVFSLAL
tara:strand:- start:409 stop:531 length:123 start_codon:yes stop_codon:yes gene_type:complete